MTRREAPPLPGDGNRTDWTPIVLGTTLTVAFTVALCALLTAAKGSLYRVEETIGWGILAGVAVWTLTLAACEALRAFHRRQARAALDRHCATTPTLVDGWAGR